MQVERLWPVYRPPYVTCVSSGVLHSSTLNHGIVWVCASKANCSGSAVCSALVVEGPA